MKKIKQHWQIILIFILLIFGMNKCSQSCNRQTTIDTQKIEIEHKDSVINAQHSIISFLEKDTADYRNQIKMYQKFDNHRNLTDSINAANLAKQQEQNELIRHQNQQIINKLNTKEEN